MQDKIKSFEDLDTWKKSHELVVYVYRVCSKLEYRDSLRNQMERAAVSITSNVAEGFGRQSFNDKKHFYVIARGSVYELQSQLYVARDTKKISEEDFHACYDKTVDSVRLIHGLIRSVSEAKDASS